MRVISLGWGVQSWTIAAMVALGELPPVDLAIHADTTHEASGTYAHAKEWAPWLEAHGVPVRTVKPDRAAIFHDDWNTVMIPAFTLDPAAQKQGQTRRQCTRYWKIVPIKAAVREELKARGLKPSPGAVTSVQGISYDEWQRMRDSDVAYIVNQYPLVDAKITRNDCKSWLASHGLPEPPKSACVFCPYHTVAQWGDMKREAGSDWTRAVAADAGLTNLYADKRKPLELFIHPGLRRLPEAVKIAEDYGASQPSFDDVVCDGGACWV